MATAIGIHYPPKIFSWYLGGATIMSYFVLLLYVMFVSFSYTGVQLFLLNGLVYIEDNERTYLVSYLPARRTLLSVSRLRGSERALHERERRGFIYWVLTGGVLGDLYGCT